jgi:ribose transport system substrate-binding protein
MKHVAVVMKNRTNPAYGAALFGAKTVAEKHGYAVRHYAPQKPDDIDEQAALVAEALAQRPAAMLLLPAHETRMSESIHAINRAAIPLVTFVGEPHEGHWDCYVGSDDAGLAREAALTVLRRLPAGAHVAIMDGHPDSITTPKRHQGFLAALAAVPGLKLVESISGYYQSAPAHEAARALLGRHARLDAMLVANDLMAMGVLQALDETGRSALLASINGSPDAVRAVRQGRLVATVSFNTLHFGCLAMEAAVRLARGETVPRRIILPADIIDETNCARWDRPYEERPLPHWDSLTYPTEENR